MQSSPIKLQSTQVVSLVKFVADVGAGEFIDELCHYHSSCINPNELSVCHSLFEEVVKHIPKRFVLTRIGLIKVAYNGDLVQARMRPQPDISKVIVVNDLANLS